MEDKGKRKKSEASYRKVKKQRVDEEAKLSNFMHRFLKKSTDHEAWERNTFYVVIDTILGSLRNRFEKNKLLFDTLSILSPLNFLKLQAFFQNNTRS